jgi:hypothetical protein
MWMSIVWGVAPRLFGIVRRRCCQHTFLQAKEKDHGISTSRLDHRCAMDIRDRVAHSHSEGHLHPPKQRYRYSARLIGSRVKRTGIVDRMLRAVAAGRCL